ncbi:hypothetical protein TVAG_096010, partial [Trichomonas vaginalis G3]
MLLIHNFTIYIFSGDEWFQHEITTYDNDTSISYKISGKSPKYYSYSVSNSSYRKVNSGEWSSSGFPVWAIVIIVIIVLIVVVALVFVCCRFCCRTADRAFSSSSSSSSKKHSRQTTTTTIYVQQQSAPSYSPPQNPSQQSYPSPYQQQPQQ